MRPLGVRFFSSWEVWKKKCRIWMLDNKSCHPATFFLGKSSYFFKSSNGYNILHLNINGLKMSNLTNFITPFPFLESILCCNHFLWWTIWYDRFLKKILSCSLYPLLVDCTILDSLPEARKVQALLLAIWNSWHLHFQVFKWPLQPPCLNFT